MVKIAPYFPVVARHANSKGKEKTPGLGKAVECVERFGRTWVLGRNERIEQMEKTRFAKARDEWLESEEGKECLAGHPAGQYLRNRLVRAFIAGWNADKEESKGQS